MKPITVKVPAWKARFNALERATVAVERAEQHMIRVALRLWRYHTPDSCIAYNVQFQAAGVRLVRARERLKKARKA